MHRGSHQKTKLSIFKSNRSQASLLSNVSSASPSDQHQQQQQHQRGDRLLDSSPQASPVSPTYSPSFTPTSTTASPLVPDDDRSPFREYNTTPIDESDTKAPSAQQNPGPRKLRRSLSHRSYPTAAVGVGSQSGSAPKASPTPDDNTEEPRTFYNSSTSLQQEKPAPEQKKKRRFFGFGDQSSSKDKSQNSTKTLGRSLSTRNSQPPLTTPTTSSGQAVSRPRWPASQNLPSPAEEDEPRGDIHARNLKLYNRHSVAFPNPTVPEELRSLVGSGGFDINSPYNTYKTEDTSATTASGQLPSSGQGGAQRTPVWERIGHRPPHHNRTVSQDQQSGHTPQQSLSHGPSTGRQGNRPELNYPEAQQQQQTSRPSSRQSVDPPSPSHSQLAFHQKSPSVQSTTSINEMGPPQPQQHSSSRSTDTPQPSSTSGSREGQYGSTLSVNQQGTGTYRGGTPQAPAMVQQNSSSEGGGRNTPPPSRSRDDLSQLDVQSLMSKHEELNDKYRKVKKYYFDKDAQVQQLQNTLAHQRLAQSRTSLDDNEYATRFSRLDGAINNLAFNIRKDWKAVPRWLAPYVNKDATTNVSKEMTAVGRACVSRWIVDEIFDRYFHPGLEPNLSSSLKIIERNLRRFAPPTQTDEEREALLAKISNWRLSTLDGLQEQLNLHDAIEFRTSLTKILVEMLTTDLTANLKDPTPPGLEAGVIGIIELAVGISANLPMESRDVYVDYVMPGTMVNDGYMKVEGALPPLTDPGEAHDPEKASLNSAEIEEEENAKEQVQQGKKKSGMFGGLIGGKQKNPPGSAGGRSQESMEQPPKDPKVRFAAFMSVEVRGKNMLIKAPVYV